MKREEEKKVSRVSWGENIFQMKRNWVNNFFVNVDLHTKLYTYKKERRPHVVLENATLKIAYNI